MAGTELPPGGNGGTDKKVSPVATLERLNPLERLAAESFAQRVRSRFGERLRCLQVFGSRSRGQASLHSDLDILVLLDQVTLAERHALSDLGVDVMLDADLPFEIAPTVMSESHFQKLIELERLFPREIDRDGIPL